MTMESHTVTAKQAYVLATAAPVTSSLVDSALHVLALHVKQHVCRRCGVTTFSASLQELHAQVAVGVLP